MAGHNTRLPIFAKFRAANCLGLAVAFQPLRAVPPALTAVRPTARPPLIAELTPRLRPLVRLDACRPPPDRPFDTPNRSPKVRPFELRGPLVREPGPAGPLVRLPGPPALAPGPGVVRPVRWSGPLLVRGPEPPDCGPLVRPPGPDPNRPLVRLPEPGPLVRDPPPGPPELVRPLAPGPDRTGLAARNAAPRPDPGPRRYRALVRSAYTPAARAATPTTSPVSAPPMIIADSAPATVATFTAPTANGTPGSPLFFWARERFGAGLGAVVPARGCGAAGGATGAADEGVPGIWMLGVGA